MKQVLLICLLLVACTGPIELKERREMMGTFVEITILDTDKERASIAMEKAFAEIGRVEMLFSHSINSSPESVLNRDGTVTADEEFVKVILTSIIYSEMSDGAFDITVQPVLTLYSKTYQTEKRAPTEEEISDTLEKIGYRKISFSGNTVSLLPGMSITTGGIAKGYAVDRAIDAIKAEGVNNALVNAGGDLRAIGNKHGRKWVLALQNPRDKKDYLLNFEIEDKAIATSGDYERFYVPDKKVHHIIDPKTAKSATDCISVTIIADDATTADALATTVFVLGPEKGMELAKHAGADALIIDKDRKITKSFS